MNSRYIPLTQQKYCCVPTCIQMVMYKNAIPLISQEEIGNALGLTVPEEDRYLFNNPRTEDMPRAGWGTQIYIDEFNPNVAFRSLGIPLHTELNLINNFSDIESIKSFLIQHENANSDILVCYDYGVLFDTDSHSGHVNVFDSYDQERDIVQLIDPEQRVPKYRKVKLARLFDALVAHGNDKSGGFWELTKI